MAGAVRGPSPKRDAERVRKEEPERGLATEISPEDLESLPFDVELLVEPPRANEDWHEIAILIYDALRRDPARMWMGAADWAISYLMCENISREMKPQAIGVVEGGIDFESGEKIAGHVAREIVPMKGQTVTAILRWAAMNGISEAGRLAIRREVTFKKDNSTAVSQSTQSKISPDRQGTGLFSIEGGAAG